MTPLATRLQEAFNRKGGTKKAFAEAVGVSPPAVNDWFSGKTQSIDGKNLIKAADYLGVSPEWLATGNGSSPSSDISEKTLTGIRVEAGALFYKDAFTHHKVKALNHLHMFEANLRNDMKDLLGICRCMPMEKRFEISKILRALIMEESTEQTYFYMQILADELWEALLTANDVQDIKRRY
jgi:transcriptional regulator with XRE-family HTH domain